MMFDKLGGAAKRLEAIDLELALPQTMANPNSLRQLMQERHALEPLVTAWQEYNRVVEEFGLTQSMAKEESDPSSLEYLKNEGDRLKSKKDELEARLKEFLLPKDPNDDRDVVMEIRAAVGGQEAGLFARELFTMYLRFAKTKGWQVEIVDMQDTEAMGIDRVEFEVHGHGAYSLLKYEAGGHRVQREPKTESSGRIHTSLATVIVLPEADELEVKIDEQRDVRVDTYNAHGKGGQGVNTTYSAVRLTHLPTGMIVTCQDERSQLKNRATAMRVLRARLYERELLARSAADSSTRKAMIGKGVRSDKIRTYNFKENRVTDHRIGLTLHRLQDVLAGDLTELIEALASTEKAQMLAQAQEQQI